MPIKRKIETRTQVLVNGEQREAIIDGDTAIIDPAPARGDTIVIRQQGVQESPQIDLLDRIVSCVVPIEEPGIFDSGAFLIEHMRSCRFPCVSWGRASGKTRLMRQIIEKRTREALIRAYAGSAETIGTIIDLDA